MNLILLLKIAALLHIGLLCAGATMARAVDLSGQLKSAPRFARRLFWVYYSFIGLVLAGFGSLTWFHADAMAAGDPLGQSLSLLMATFWLVRCVVAAWVLDVRPYLATRLHRLGHYGLNVVFLYLTAVYGWTAIQGILR